MYFQEVDSYFSDVWGFCARTLQGEHGRPLRLALPAHDSSAWVTTTQFNAVVVSTPDSSSGFVSSVRETRSTSATSAWVAAGARPGSVDEDDGTTWVDRPRAAGRTDSPSGVGVGGTTNRVEGKATTIAENTDGGAGAGSRSGGSGSDAASSGSKADDGVVRSGQGSSRDRTAVSSTSLDEASDDFVIVDDHFDGSTAKAAAAAYDDLDVDVDELHQRAERLEALIRSQDLTSPVQVIDLLPHFIRSFFPLLLLLF